MHSFFFLAVFVSTSVVLFKLMKHKVLAGTFADSELCDFQTSASVSMRWNYRDKMTAL